MGKPLLTCASAPHRTGKLRFTTLAHTTRRLFAGAARAEGAACGNALLSPPPVKPGVDEPYRAGFHQIISKGFP